MIKWIWISELYNISVLYAYNYDPTLSSHTL